MGTFHQGKFKPKNPAKYRGNAGNIVYRSSWEKRMMAYFDSHPDVIEWQSEELIVPYKSPVDNRIHRYFPDFIVKFKDKEGRIKTVMYEVKPKAQTVPPKVPKRKTRKYVEEVMTYAVNEAKWKHAKSFCSSRGWEFAILTENEIYGG